MNGTFPDAGRWADLPRQAGLALLYALLATVMVGHFSDHAFVSHAWPPSGLALAALLIGGKKYWIGILSGALAYNLIADHSVWLSAGIALGNTLEAFGAFWILSRLRPMAKAPSLLPKIFRITPDAYGFDAALTRPRDYLLLIGVGALTSTVAALVGTSALLQAGLLAAPEFPHNLLKWWMGDTLGIMLVTPLILVWRQAPRDWLTRERAPEILTCFLLAFLCGQSIFLAWFDNSINRGYWMFLFVTWGAVRFGRHGALLIIAMAAVQGLLGANHGIGYFGENTGQAQLSHYWFYMALLTLIGMLLATIIHERKQAEMALRAGEERWSFALEGAGDGVWDWDIQTGKVSFSKRWREIFGFAENEAVDQVELWRNRIHPEDLQRALADEQAYFDGKTSQYVNEHRVQCKDGSWKWILERGMVVSRNSAGDPLRMIGTQTDITERKQAEAALRASEARFRSLTQLGSDWYWELDENLRFTEITGDKLFHKSLSLLESIGQSNWEVGVMGFDEGAWQSHRALLERHESFRNFEIGRLDENIRLHAISLSGEPIFDEAHRFVGYRGVGTDITRRKQAEEALKNAAEELRQQKNEAEKTSLAKSRFLAAASHDLRQPLHALSLFAAEFEQQTTTFTQRRLLQQIRTAIDAMNEQLNPLLDISRLDLGDALPRREAVALQPLLERVVAMHRHSANAKGLSLRLVPTAAWGESDASLLERMLGNLISNAVRYTNEGGVVVGVRRSGNDWRVEIRDTGIGIAKEQLSLIFQEFYQIDNPERDAGKGLGLGLAIVARLGQMLDHRVKVCSSAGLGSVFGIELPRAAPSMRSQGADESPRAGNFDFNAKVVVGCGSDAAGASLCNLLEGWGCRVTNAVDDAALHRALAGQPEVLICEDGGYASATEYYRARQDAAPILILLGATAGAAPQNGMAPHGQLAKPLQPARLRALLRHLLDESKHRES